MNMEFPCLDCECHGLHHIHSLFFWCDQCNKIFRVSFIETREGTGIMNFEFIYEMV